MSSPRTPGAVRFAWEAESRSLYRKRTEVVCLLGIPLVLLFSAVDAVMFPDQVGYFCLLRIACAAVLGLIVAVLQSPFGAEHPIALGLFASNVVGLMIDEIAMSTGRELSPYYAGITMTQMAVSVLIPWPASWASAGQLALIGGYVACIAAGGPLTSPAAMVNNLAFLVGTALIGLVASTIREQLRWEEFTSRTALAEALRHKSEFMAKMSHELRTPLHVIIGYADMVLEDGSQTRESRDLVGHIRGRGVVLHGLISDLLDYAKVEAGKMEVRLAPVRVDDVVQRVATGFRPLLEQKRLHLETTTADASLELVSDAMKLEQILTNLVANAVKFTERGGIRIEVRRAREGDASLTGLVFLDGDAAPAAAPGREPERLAILIHDTGIGIARDDVPRLAADFVQLDGTAARFGGTGLGLSISKRLTQLLGGRIAVRSTPAEGSTFAVVLPLAP